MVYSRPEWGCCKIDTETNDDKDDFQEVLLQKIKSVCTLMEYLPAISLLHLSHHQEEGYECFSYLE